MEQLEKKLIAVVLVLMALFTGLVAYAAIGLGIVLPSCQEHVTPFKEGQVIPGVNNKFEVHYVARMWSFEPAELILPQNADVDLYVSALDVNHGFQVVGTNVNLMAVPGTVNGARHQFKTKGEFLVICHEYCGLNHQNMVGRIKVVDAGEYARLMEDLAGKVKALGQKLSEAKDCASCHTVDGTEGIGPTFKGLYGKREKLSDGREIIVDDHYLMESMEEPDEEVVLHYDAGSMPKAELTEEEMKEIVAYIKTLK